ncbi:MAG: ParB/RepB/Spo0J family partition protein [Culicoidibacterales bacterium]
MASPKQPKKRLGKGIEALFSNNGIESEVAKLEDVTGYDIMEVEVSKIRPNPYQPRKHFKEEALQELAQSIRTQGVFQPLIVRKSVKGYDLLAGERRLRASKIAGLKTVPVIIKDYTEAEMMEIALLENLQREDLSAIEESKAYKQLMENLHLTQEELSARVGKSRSHISNTLRLLQLPENIQNAIETGKITMGHAKVLVTVENEKIMNQIVDLIIEEHLSVREVEHLVQNIRTGTPSPIKKAKKQVKKDSQIERLENNLSKMFNQNVKLAYSNHRGKITIPFKNDEELNIVLEKMGLLEKEIDA